MAKHYDEDTEAVLYNPEITAERLKTARPFREMFPKMTAKLEEGIAAEAKNKPGRPRLVHSKEIITLRIDERVTSHFRSQGGRWRAKMAKALEQIMLKKMTFL